ncbi:MAG: galactokinase [Marinilabiliaceae bacterium]|nr:galactokinase [Marinilabiliaceae bacterium]
MELEVLKKSFIEKYGEGDIQVFFSPGRVNLIGEHTDYNGGYVFPCALSFGTYILARKTKIDEVRFASTNLELEVSIPVSKLSEKQPNGAWVNYCLGVMKEFAAKGVKFSGMDILVSGNIPNGAGLSSSASLELVTAVMCNEYYNVGLDNLEMAWMGKAAENNFVGVNCGILDQFAVAMGKKDNAMALKCDTMEFEHVPVKLGDYKIVISNTNKRRGLADSKYNERVEECGKAVKDICTVKQIKLLGDIDLNEFESLKNSIKNETVLRRARHVISENQRVVDAIPALKRGDLKAFGELMNASHDSLRDDYEVTGIELDTLVEESRKVSGVIGSRMTGAGFGGCTVSLVHKDSVESFKTEVSEKYTAKIGLIPDFYVAEVGDGAKQIE